MAVTGSIARPGASIKGEPTTEVLRAEMYRARDELRAAGHRPPKRLMNAFAEARDAYHRRLREENA